MAFVAMEPPVSLSAEHLRDEKEKVFEALRPIDVQHVVRGQYQGYRSEPGVAADSQTDTMVALRAEVDNWRWQGIPFFLRSGKAMGASRQIVTLGFHQPPLCMFRARLDRPAHQGPGMVSAARSRAGALRHRPRRTQAGLRSAGARRTPDRQPRPSA